MAFKRLRALRPILFSSVAILSIQAAAAAQDTQISIQAQPMSDALRSVAQKTGESILFTPESVEGLRAPAISGQMSAEQAVSMLTRGTDLEVVSDGVRLHDCYQRLQGAEAGVAELYARWAELEEKQQL